MRRTAPALLTTLLAAGLLPLATPAPAAAAPTCYAPVPTALCGGRVVAEPEMSTSFHQYDTPFESVKKSLEAIEARSPDFLEAGPISEFTGNPEHVSFGKRDIWVVRVTDEKVARAGKKQVAASLSVHGLESAGREGGLRYIEDLAIWTADLRAGRDRPLYSGGVERPISQVMAQTESWFAFTNPDGWATGDLTSRTPGGFRRGNDNGAGPVSTAVTSGKDLNRDLPTVGWYDRTGGRGIAESEPETRAWVALVESFPDLVTSTDIHGELTTPNQAFADLIIPAGQWTPTRQQQVKQLGDNMIGTIDRKFREEGVVLDRVFGPLPDADGRTPRRPANVAASYDIVGYDDSGFMGDWFSQRQDSVHMDVENFLSNLVPNNVYTPAVEEAHVAAVRGILESVVVEAMVTRDVRPALTARSFAYVDDPNRTTSADGTLSAVVAGETQVPYDVTRMRYFEEIERTTGRPAVPLSAEAIADGTAGLSSFDSLVLADMELPKGSTADRGRYVAALRAFTEAGGQLVLTDQAVTLVDDLTGDASLSHTVNRTDAGHVDFVGALGDHPYEKGLVGKPSQTFYEVMLGFPSRGRTPNYGIERGAFERAGGTTVATVGPQDGPSPNTALGTLPLGKGKVVLFGALLPQAIEQLVLETGQVIETPHPFGLADYAVTITGGQVLDNILAFARADGSTGAGNGPAAASPSPSAGSPAPSPAPPVPGPPSPAVGTTPSARPSGPAPTSSPSGPAPAPAPSCTTPTAAVELERSTIVSGESVALRVQGAPGAVLDLHAYTRPSTTYRAVRTVRLGPDGTAVLGVTPPASTRMYAQQRDCPAGPSSAVTVRSSVSLDAARTGTRTYRFSGNSLPKRAGGLPVSVYRVQPGGAEVLVGRTSTDGSTGRWSLTRTFSGTGRLAFVARTAEDASNAAGASAVRTVTVR